MALNPAALASNSVAEETPRTTSAMRPLRSGARIATMMPPRSVISALKPDLLVSVKSFASRPSASRPNARLGTSVAEGSAGASRQARATVKTARRRRAWGMAVVSHGGRGEASAHFVVVGAEKLR